MKTAFGEISRANRISLEIEPDRGSTSVIVRAKLLPLASLFLILQLGIAAGANYREQRDD